MAAAPGGRRSDRGTGEGRIKEGFFFFFSWVLFAHSSSWTGSVPQQGKLIKVQRKRLETVERWGVATGALGSFLITPDSFSLAFPFPHHLRVERSPPAPSDLGSGSSPW